MLFADVDIERISAVESVADGLHVNYEHLRPDEFSDDRIAVPAHSTVLREPPPGGFIDPRRMVPAQLAICKQQGAEIIGTHVLDITREDGGWSLHGGRLRRCLPASC